MADSTRLQVLKAITAQLETITVVNGYQFDLADSVFRGRTGFGDETQLPCVGIFEMRPEDAVRADETIQRDEWFLAIQGYVDADEVHPTDPAHNLMADVKRCLAQIMRAGTPDQPNPNHMFDWLITDMKLDGGVVMPPSADITGVAVFLLKVTITIVDDLENPYG